MAEELLVKCKGCYAPFAVPDQIERATFEAADVQMTSYRCPHCGIRRPYDKGDYYFGSPGADASPLDDLLGPG